MDNPHIIPSNATSDTPDMANADMASANAPEPAPAPTPTDYVRSESYIEPDKSVTRAMGEEFARDNPLWVESRDACGIWGADPSEGRHAPSGKDYSDAMIAIRRDYRWTPACQRAFLQELACTGSVTRACHHVEKTARSAYDLRYRRDGAAFALGWDAAILIARMGFADVLMDRAIHGYEEVYSRTDNGDVVRGKYDNRLSFAMLTRLDRIAEAQAAKSSALYGQGHGAQVRMVCQDFESFLDLIERGGAGAEAALFCTARDDQPMGKMHSAIPHAIDCELDRISADAADMDPADMTPEAAAHSMTIWYDQDEEEWRTNFPVRTPQDAANVTEYGIFGRAEYERTLTAAEESAHEAALAVQLAPLRAAAEAAYDAWFGAKAAA
jgi:hypothetical protein